MPKSPMVILALLTAVAPRAASAPPAATEVVPPPKAAPFEVVSCAVDASVFGVGVAIRVRNLDASRKLEPVGPQPRLLGIA